MSPTTPLAAQLENVLDLRKAFPRSPNDLLGPYVILARTIDKCRADIAGMAGEYHWNCGLAQMFFQFKEIDPMAFRAQLEAGKSDPDMLAWVEQAGAPKTEDEILAWGYDCRWATPHNVEKKAYVERSARAIQPYPPYIQTFFQLLDAEEGRL